MVDEPLGSEEVTEPDQFCLQLRTPRYGAEPLLDGAQFGSAKGRVAEEEQVSEEAGGRMEQQKASRKGQFCPVASPKEERSFHAAGGVFDGFQASSSCFVLRPRRLQRSDSAPEEDALGPLGPTCRRVREALYQGILQMQRRGLPDVSQRAPDVRGRPHRCDPRVQQVRGVRSCLGAECWGSSSRLLLES